MNIKNKGLVKIEQTDPSKMAGLKARFVIDRETRLRNNIGFEVYDAKKKSVNTVYVSSLRVGGGMSFFSSTSGEFFAIDLFLINRRSINRGLTSVVEKITKDKVSLIFHCDDESIYVSENKALMIDDSSFAPALDIAHVCSVTYSGDTTLASFICSGVKTAMDHLYDPDLSYSKKNEYRDLKDNHIYFHINNESVLGLSNVKTPINIKDVAPENRDFYSAFFSGEEIYLSDTDGEQKELLEEMMVSLHSHLEMSILSHLDINKDDEVSNSSDYILFVLKMSDLSIFKKIGLIYKIFDGTFRMKDLAECLSSIDLDEMTITYLGGVLYSIESDSIESNKWALLSKLLHNNLPTS
jgi:hypothetical protein